VRALLLVLATLTFQQPAASRVLLATVSAGNRAIVDLDIDDFVIDLGGATGDVVDVHVADYPIAVLVDTSAGAPGERTAILEAAARFVTRVGDRAVAAGTLAGRSGMFATFDDDRADVLARIRTAPEAPAAMPLEAIAQAVSLIQQSGTPFSAIVVISAHAADPGMFGSSEAVETIVKAQIPVHVIAHREAAAPGEAAGDTMREVSALTHGQFITIYSTASYPVALDRLADRLSTEVMVQFLVPPGAPVDGEVRAGVRIPGAKVTGLGVSR
jgi:hypothetical protein